jgi:predicted membrane-bound spermidine synthase
MTELTQSPRPMTGRAGRGPLPGNPFQVDEKQRSTAIGRRAPSIALFAVFLLSGAAAIVYQLAWQRVLFSIYGIDIASVTVVVTAFMLGLGVGSLIGGALSHRAPSASLPLFACFELGIGIFGILSLTLFDRVAAFTLGIGHSETFVITFLLVLLPTTLMGATLPLLVSHATRRSGNVGRSVGNLYFVNTLGAAAGAFVSVEFMFGSLGLSSSVRWVALLNLALGAIVFGISVCERRRIAT